MFVKVIVTPGAKKELLQVGPDGRLRISVKAKAKQNQANLRVKELLAQHYQISTKAVRLVSGHQAHTKIVSIDL